MNKIRSAKLCWDMLLMADGCLSTFNSLLEGSTTP